MEGSDSCFCPLDGEGMGVVELLLGGLGLEALEAEPRQAERAEASVSTPLFEQADRCG